MTYTSLYPWVLALVLLQMGLYDNRNKLWWGWEINSYQLLLGSWHSDGIIFEQLTECHSSIDVKHTYSYRIILANSPAVIELLKSFLAIETVFFYSSDWNICISKSIWKLISSHFRLTLLFALENNFLCQLYIYNLP